MTDVTESNEGFAEVTATVVTHGKSGFLPRHFPTHFMRFESIVMSLMRKTCVEYSGGLWEFMSLSNDGLFVVPPSPGPNGVYAMDLTKIGVHWEGNVGVEAAGIIVSLYALSFLANKFQGDNEIEKYYALRDFACEHKESSQILAAID